MARGDNRRRRLSKLQEGSCDITISKREIQKRPYLVGDTICRQHRPSNTEACKSNRWRWIHSVDAASKSKCETVLGMACARNTFTFFASNNQTYGKGTTKDSAAGSSGIIVRAPWAIWTKT